MTETLERTGRPSSDSAAHEAAGNAPGWQKRLWTADNAVLGVLLVALSASFFYGWFLDSSHPVGGRGWADQSTYTATARRLADFHWPTRTMLHYQPGYALLGAFGTLVSRRDPFWLVSYALLIGSAIFCYRACRTRYNIAFTAMFLLSLFWWDGRARTFATASELFAIPWNNQVLFFAFAFFFWLFTAKREATVDTKLAAVIGGLCGFVYATREEGVLFVVPLAIVYLIARRSPLRSWITAGVASFAAALPALVIKYHVVGSIFASGRIRRSSYGEQASNYFSIGRVWRNVTQVVVDADFANFDTRRQALLEATPWLWLGVLGVVVVLVSSRFDLLTKTFVGMSLLLIAFYLSGANVSAAKLKVHCLRYMSPGYIALHFAVVVVLAEGWRLFRQWRLRRA